jgi:hypothetical protein
MFGIHDARSKITEFFQGEFGKEPEAVHFLKIAKSEVGWEGIVEITEQNEYLKKLGFPPIFDKNHYAVELDENLNVTRYGKEEE